MPNVKPRRPTGKGWRYRGHPALPGLRHAEHWAHDSGIHCLSSIDVADQDYHGSGVVAPHFHVSATMRVILPARACTDQEMELVRGAFDLGGAEEDNHGRGIARHLWAVVGRDREPKCPCKQDQDAIVEGPRVRHDEAPES